ADTAYASLALQGIGVGHRRGLCEAIPLDQATASELLKGLLYLNRQRRRATDAELNRGNAVVPDPGVVGNGKIEGWDCGKNAGMIVLDRLHNLLNACGGQQHKRAGQRHSEVERASDSVGVCQRKHTEQYLTPPLCLGHPVADLCYIDQQIAMG